jgi:hypothetical protein
VQRIPWSAAVRPTRRAISPRLAIKTEVMGLIEALATVCWYREVDLEARSTLASAREREVCVNGIGVTVAS